MNKYLIIFCLLFFSIFSYGNEQVTLQLKWFHQFQFAGYYAAKEKGFYEEVGLDVIIKERDIKYNNIEQVINNEAQYGIADSILFLYKAKNEPIVLISPIFQHSPSVLMTLKSSGIDTPYDLNNKDVIFYPNDTDGFSILAMLKKLNVKPNLIRERTKNDYLKLLNKEVVASPAYLSNEPFYFKTNKIDINIFNPSNYGFDLYGDILFTNKNEVLNHPERVEKFRNATIKGWEYALNNQEEIIQLIHNKYGSNKTIEHLRYEAKIIEKLVEKDSLPIGSLDKGRIKYIYDLYKENELISTNADLKDFIFEEYKKENNILFTQEEEEYLKEHQVLKVQNLSSFPPFNFQNENRPLGYIIDYMELLTKQLGIKLQFISNKTWAENLKMLSTNELDILPHVAINSERKKYIEYTNFSLISFIPAFTVNKHSNIRNFSDLNGKTLAVVNKYFLQTILEDNYPNIKLYLVENTGKGIEAVVNGNADAMIDNLATLEYYIKNNWYSNLKTIAISNNLNFTSTPLFLGVSKGNNLLISILEKANNSIPHSEIIKLKEKWNSKEILQKIFLSDEELEFLKNKNELKMCIDPNWMPYEKIEDNRHIGITSDYIKIFQEQLPIPIKLISTNSWSQTLEFAKEKKCDFVTAMIKTKDREKYFNFSNDYLKSPLVIATKIDKPFINNISSVLDKKFGIVKGYAYKNKLKSEYPNIKIVDVDNIELGLEKVDKGELFGMIDSLPVIGFQIQNKYPTNLKVTGKLNGEWGLSLASRNDEPLINNIINKFINNIPIEQHNEIINKWVSVKYQQNIDYKKIIYIVLFFIIILAILIYKNKSISKLNKKMQSYVNIIDENVITSSTNKKGIIINVSKAFCDISGYSKDELIGKSHSIVRHEEMSSELFKELWKNISSGKVWRGEIKNKRKNGTSYWVDVIISPDFDNSKNIIGYTAIRHDITDKKQVEYLSITDELTTLYNKRYFNKILDKEINNMKRDEHRIGLIIFDVDHFKQYNDNYGHQKGDIVLETIGKEINSICKRSSDIPFRIGGEEFAIIFHPHFKENALEFAELIRKRIEALKIEHKFNSASQYITISIGVYTEQGEKIKSSNEIYNICDNALYKAKSMGRNQYVLY